MSREGRRAVFALAVNFACLNSIAFAEVLIQRRSFADRDNILLVASQNSCDALGSSLDELLQHYRSEGRSQSRLLCIPQKTVVKKNPSEIRQLILPHARTVEGIILIGSDLAPFEYFHRTFFGEAMGNYSYGTTDLPYGNLDDVFWSKPLKKSSTGIAEQVYRSQNFVYPMGAPTPYTYDFDQWVKRELDRGPVYHYQQQKWVSRWMATTAHLKNAFENFIQRREKYFPAQNQWAVYAREAEDTGTSLSADQIYSIMFDALKIRMDTMPEGSEFEIHVKSDIVQMTQSLSSNATLLALEAHGQPESLGLLNAAEFGVSIHRLPEIFVAHSCLVGAWGYATTPDLSFVAKAFSIEKPPLAMTASQGVLGIPLITDGGYDVPRPYLTYWKAGQSLGERQIESINESLKGWRSYVSIYMNYNPVFTAGELFHSISIFGDGTIEL